MCRFRSWRHWDQPGVARSTLSGTAAEPAQCTGRALKLPESAQEAAKGTSSRNPQKAELGCVLVHL